MKHLKIKDLLTEGKGLFLAMDQGLEHGPKDFNLKTIDPDYVLNIAVKGKFNGMMLQKGIAEHYYEHYAYKVPLILKLNGKTSIAKVDPYSAQNCSLKHAVKLKAKAVGYTIYLGSPHEQQMFREFSKIQEEAHDYGLPVIVWMYPRGPFVPNDTDVDVLAYGARTALELGADFVKIKHNTDLAGYKWVVNCAGKCKLLVAGGSKRPHEQFLRDVKDMMRAGATGLAVGRNVWQDRKPLAVANALKAIIFGNKSVEAAMKLIKK